MKNVFLILCFFINNNKIFSQNAFKRAKQRLSFKANALRKMAERAFQCGKALADMKGILYNCAERIWLSGHNVNNIRVYGEVFYLFANNTLLTLYQVPYNLKKSLSF